MNYVEQFQNLSQEEAIKSIYASLNSKALDALSVVENTPVAEEIAVSE